MENFVETRDLRTHFPILKGVIRRPVGRVRAVDGVSITVNRGEWLGLVGESGCGKTTLGKTMIRLLQPVSGHIYFDTPGWIKDEINTLEKSGANPKRKEGLVRKYDLATYRRSRLKAVRKLMQLVQQDPFTSLDPRMKIRDILAEPLEVHKVMQNRRQIRERVIEVLRMVGLSEKQMDRYPHQFSGGQRQRIAIARALSINPSFVVLDEPTSALDVSVQAQILGLLGQLKNDLGLTYLYITHDLNVAETVCDSIAVMYLGKIVEVSTPMRLFRAPKHPYSQALVSATPIADPQRKRGRITMHGEVPSPANPPSGCRFHPRCHRATEECRHTEPAIQAHAGGGVVACWHPLA